MIAYAQTLAPVTTAATTSSGVNWWALAALAVALLAVLGIVLYLRLRRRNPAAAAAIQTKIGNDAEAFAHAIAVAADSAVDRLIQARLAKMEAPPEPAAPAAPAPSAGKAGQAGTFTLEVTGDPATDWPAITAAYYRTAPTPSA